MTKRTAPRTTVDAAQRVLNGRYELHEQLGAGAEGVVVRGFDRQHGRSVALKIRRAEGDARRDEMLREASVLLSLRPHGGVASARDDFFADGSHVLVMDWVDGESLAEVVEARGDPGITPSLALRYLEQLAAAIDHLHAHDPPIVHGDVKPANAMLTRDGRVVLVDFGLAGGARRAGTIGYLAPEISAGGAGTTAADVFGLAATATTLITGLPPLVGRPRFDGVDPRVAGRIERVLARGLAVDPARRPGTAGELVERLGHALAPDLPEGVVTLLAAMPQVDGSGSDLAPDTARSVAVRGHALVARAVEDHAGQCIGITGDDGGSLAVFSRAIDAADAALDLGRAFNRADWPEALVPEVCVALHTGEVAVVQGQYSGTHVSTVVRLARLTLGGQIVCSSTTAELLASPPPGTSLRDLGRLRLRDRGEAVQVFQLRVTGDPSGSWPLRSRGIETAHNLPPQLSRFVGREQELADLPRLLREGRLATLVGTGGVGKTRLSVELASSMLDGTFEGVWFVELASLTDGADVAARVARVVGARERPGARPIDALVGALRDRTVLVVLDNCEHLTAACAQLVDALVSACPNTHVLATSREPLRIDGERVLRIAGLPLPAKRVVSARQLTDSAAVDLFFDRIRAHGADMTPDNRNAGHVSSICSRVDGIPLAIELAAARAPSMSLAAIDERLQRCFDILSHGPRNAVPRHKTLRTTIDWSYKLLTDDERSLLRRLAVFSAGFDLDAAEAVCGLAPTQTDVATVLSSLVDKSLVVVDASNSDMRYRLLETIRQFAADVSAWDEREAVRARHARHFAGWAETIGPQMEGRNYAAACHRILTERDNLHAALDWLAASPTRRVELLQALVSLKDWWVSNRCDAARYLVPALDGDTSEVPGDLYVSACSLAVYSVIHTDRGAARAYGRLAVDRSRILGNDAARVEGLTAYAVSTYMDDDDAREVVIGEAVDLAKRVGDTRLLVTALMVQLGELNSGPRAACVASQAIALADEGNHKMLAASARFLATNIHLASGDIDMAGRLLEEHLAILADVPDIGDQAVTWTMLGHVRQQQGRAGEAAGLFRNAFIEQCCPGNEYQLAPVARGLATCARHSDDPRTAAVLHGLADRLLDDVGWVETEPFHSYRANDFAVLSADPDFDAHYRAGRALSLGDALDLVVDTFPPDS